MPSHKNFANAGRKAGLEIWRIEKFEPVPVPPNKYGVFFEGDSYIALSTVGTSTFTWEIYFWLGSKTSVDEAGAAARLSVELDDSLGGAPIQHRETQGHESTQFIGLFQSGVRYMPGGVESGFNHVTSSAPGEKRLYHIKGKHNVRTTLVEPKIQSMNKGDCFVLDTGSELFLYVGPNSQGVEALTARKVANQIRDQDHCGKAIITTIDSSLTADDDAKLQEFLTALGGTSRDEVPDASAAGDDLEFEKNLNTSIALYKVSNGEGKMKIEKVTDKALGRNHLDTNDCFILDVGKAGIYVWIGKKSNVQEKQEAFTKGQAFIEEKNYPSWTTLRRIVEDGEPTIFKGYFTNW